MVVELAALLALAGAPQLETAAMCRRIATYLTERRFPSIASAVAATASETLAASLREDREWVGGVLRDPTGGYRVTSGHACSGQATVTFSVPVTAPFELVAFWHTHGADGFERDWFSRDDARLVARTGKDFYLVTPRGELKVLTPHDVASWKAEAPGTLLLDAAATAELSRQSAVEVGAVEPDAADAPSSEG